MEKLINAFDSHTHFWATGQVAEGLKLHDLKSAEAVSELKILPQHYRSQWLVGFGWNQNEWPQKTFPDKKILDKVFPDTPVFFSRVDGHASWINSCGLRELSKLGFDFSKNINGGVIARDERGEPTGILLDQAHIAALMKLPDFSNQQHQLFFKTSQSIFNKAGFTHIRDMSMHEGAWNILRQMEDQKQLTVAVESLVTAESLDDLSNVLTVIKKLRADGSQQLRVAGVKIFIDGSLGSQTAFVSEPYAGSQENGLLIWKPEEIKAVLRAAWPLGYQVAIHCIGDAAVTTAVQAAREVSADGILGRLNLEHVQLISPETVQLMKPLHITCHMQPCHWLSDKSFLKESLSPKLFSYLFQWELLRKNKIPFFFGSDSPIERPSLADNIKALADSTEAGIPALKADWKVYHQHPDAGWIASHTEIESGAVKQVYFRGEPLL
jgi:predicted amidohydrolase YtcJ